MLWYLIYSIPKPKPTCSPSAHLTAPKIVFCLTVRVLNASNSELVTNAHSGLGTLISDTEADLNEVDHQDIELTNPTICRSSNGADKKMGR